MAENQTKNTPTTTSNQTPLSSGLANQTQQASTGTSASSTPGQVNQVVTWVVTAPGVPNNNTVPPWAFIPQTAKSSTGSIGPSSIQTPQSGVSNTLLSPIKANTSSETSSKATSIPNTLQSIGNTPNINNPQPPPQWTMAPIFSPAIAFHPHPPPNSFHYHFNPGFNPPNQINHTYSNPNPAVSTTKTVDSNQQLPPKANTTSAPSVYNIMNPNNSGISSASNALPQSIHANKNNIMTVVLPYGTTVPNKNDTMHIPPPPPPTSNNNIATPTTTTATPTIATLQNAPTMIDSPKHNDSESKTISSHFTPNNNSNIPPIDIDTSTNMTSATNESVNPSNQNSNTNNNDNDNTPYAQKYKITPQQLSDSIPTNASSIFHIYDRRIYMDAFVSDNVSTFSPNTTTTAMPNNSPSLYSLLRSWVQDDPYRRNLIHDVNIVDKVDLPSLRWRNDGMKPKSSSSLLTTNNTTHDHDITIQSAQSISNMKNIQNEKMTKNDSKRNNNVDILSILSDHNHSEKINHVGNDDNIIDTDIGDHKKDVDNDAAESKPKLSPQSLLASHIVNAKRKRNQVICTRNQKRKDMGCYERLQVFGLYHSPKK